MAIGVAIATDCFNVGSRTDNRDTFLCLSKEKYPKEKTPGFRPDPALHSFLQGLAKGASCPFANERHPCRSPHGLILQKTAMLGVETRDQNRLQR